ncbi:MAG: nucleotidyltransferase domain-containing protein [Pseudomonadota bacterium]
MAPGKANALIKAKKLISLMKSNGIDVYEAYMFGSAATDKMNDHSDIDIAIVSNQFTGIPFYDALKISKFRRSVDLTIEVHSFSLKDILNDPPLFFLEIKSKGIRIN